MAAWLLRRQRRVEAQACGTSSQATDTASETINHSHLPSNIDLALKICHHNADESIQEKTCRVFLPRLREKKTNLPHGRLPFETREEANSASTMPEQLLRNSATR